MEQAMNARQSKRPDGWWYPYIFVGAFMVVIGVNGALAFFATSTFNGLETRNAYEKGRLYNQTLAAEEQQRALGWKMDLTAEAVADRKPGAGYPTQVVLVAAGPDGAALDGLTVTAEVRRPTQAGMDQDIALVRRDAGSYGTTVTLPQPGNWDVRVVATRGDDIYRYTERIFVK